uniref:Uncharacterized protein n=1 Tax=Gopherus agassizii TaxID=38772 RepID=A0A452GSG0_9SAUR
NTPTDVVCVTPTHCLFVWASRGVLSQTLHLHQPQGVIAVGGNVTIRCHHQLLDMRILLYKNEDENYLNYTDPAGSEAEFPITSARWEHGGTYTCCYIYRSRGTAYSEPSDPVQITFSVGNVRREHGGSYSCSYHSRSEPFTVLDPSDPVELVVKGEGPSSASPPGLHNLLRQGVPQVDCALCEEELPFICFKPAAH